MSEASPTKKKKMKLFPTWAPQSAGLSFFSYFFVHAFSSFCVGKRVKEGYVLMGDVNRMGVEGMTLCRTLRPRYLARLDGPGLVCLVPDSRGFYGSIFCITLRALPKLNGKLLGRFNTYISLFAFCFATCNHQNTVVIGRIYGKESRKNLYALGCAWNPTGKLWRTFVRIDSTRQLLSEYSQKKLEKKRKLAIEKQKFEKDNSPTRS